MLKFFYAILVGLVGAGIVHVAVLLLLPQFSKRDAWQSLADSADFYKAVRIDANDGGPPLVEGMDPLFHAAACRFDLKEGPVRLHASGTVPFWSASVYDRAGQNLYSFNDRASEGALDFVVLTSDQMIEVRKSAPEDYRASVFVQVPVGEGIVVVRTFVPDPTWEASTTDFLARLACTND